MRVPLTAVLRSEWTKLRTLRSTWWCTAVYVLVVGSFAWLAAATTRSAPTADSAVGVVLTGFAFGQVVLVVLGVLALAAVDLPFLNAFTAVVLILSGLFLVGTVVFVRRQERLEQARAHRPPGERGTAGAYRAAPHGN